MKYQPSIAALALAATAQVFSSAVIAQDDEPLEEIVVTGIRGSLAAAVDQKRDSDQLVEVIIAEDIGKLPDQNLAEVLENITGIQITPYGRRRHRRSDPRQRIQYRVEFNGVSTVNSGSGRSGINFEDVNPAIISAVEVTKSPDARTIEGLRWRHDQPQDDSPA